MVMAVLSAALAGDALPVWAETAQTSANSSKFSCVYTRHKDGSHGAAVFDVKTEKGWFETDDEYIYRMNMAAIDHPAEAASMSHTITIDKVSGLFVASSVYLGEGGGKLPKSRDSADTGKCQQIK